MRAALLAGALLVLVALSGCSGQGAPEAEQADDDRSGRRSVGGNGENASVPMEDVVLLDAPIKLDATNPEASFQVEVPLNITKVVAHITSPGAAYQEEGLAMSLEGCGGFDNAGSSSGSFGGPTSTTHVVCDGAAPGSHAFTISGGPAQYIEGNLRLVGKRPLGNATA